MRSLDPGDLSLSPVVSQLALGAQGLVVVAGPRGSGRSTTLAAMVRAVLVQGSHHVVVLEEGHEFLHPSQQSLLTQRLLPSDRRRWPAAIRSVTRQDADVLFLGSLGDRACLLEALREAARGTRVIGVCRGGSVTSVVERMSQALPARSRLLAEHLGGVVVQHLVPADALGTCVPVLEVLVATSSVSNLLFEEKWHQLYQAMQCGARHGMQTLEQALAERVLLGHVALEEALAHAKQPQELDRIISAMLAKVLADRPET